jgi:uncharacterized glyoxalase superfamily protein PhnB
MTPSDIHPCLTYADAAAAIDWLCRVFGFEKRLVVPGENGTVVHSELSLGTGVVMVSSEKPEMGRFGPAHPQGGRTTLSVCVADPDGHYKRATGLGAKVLHPLKDEEYGARGYGAEDLEGHSWYFSNYRPGQYWEGGSSQPQS